MPINDQPKRLGRKKQRNDKRDMLILLRAIVLLFKKREEEAEENVIHRVSQWSSGMQNNVNVRLV